MSNVLRLLGVLNPRLCKLVNIEEQVLAQLYLRMVSLWLLPVSRGKTTLAIRHGT